jgi:hypothetical protein
MEERDELFTTGFYRDLVNSQAETNATLRLLADRLGSATDGLEHLEPILTDFGQRLSKVEGQINTTKRALKWGASIFASSIGALLTYRKEITQTIKQLFP